MISCLLLDANDARMEANERTSVGYGLHRFEFPFTWIYSGKIKRKKVPGEVEER